MVMCVAMYVTERVIGLSDPMTRLLALFGLNVVIAILVFGILDRGVFVRGSARQRRALDAPARRAPAVT